ncbi:MAG: hypothetical protein ACO1SV_00945 [Fimbriimonas sp.]
MKPILAIALGLVVSATTVLSKQESGAPAIKSMPVPLEGPVEMSKQESGR